MALNEINCVSARRSGGENDEKIESVRDGVVRMWGGRRERREEGKKEVEMGEDMREW